MRLYLLAEKQADEIIAKMKYYFEKDIELQEKRRLACQKINYLEELGRSLKNVSYYLHRSTSVRSSSNGMVCPSSNVGWTRLPSTTRQSNLECP